MLPKGHQSAIEPVPKPRLLTRYCGGDLHLGVVRKRARWNDVEPVPVGRGNGVREVGLLTEHKGANRVVPVDVALGDGARQGRAAGLRICVQEEGVITAKRQALGQSERGRRLGHATLGIDDGNHQSLFARLARRNRAAVLDPPARVLKRKSTRGSGRSDASEGQGLWLAWLRAAICALGVLSLRRADPIVHGGLAQSAHLSQLIGGKYRSLFLRVGAEHHGARGLQHFAAFVPLSGQIRDGKRTDRLFDLKLHFRVVPRYRHANSLREPRV